MLSFQWRESSHFQRKYRQFWIITTTKKQKTKQNKTKQNKKWGILEIYKQCHKMTNIIQTSIIKKSRPPSPPHTRDGSRPPSPPHTRDGSRPPSPPHIRDGSRPPSPPHTRDGYMTSLVQYMYIWCICIYDVYNSGYIGGRSAYICLVDDHLWRCEVCSIQLYMKKFDRDWRYVADFLQLLVKI
jgi:hypothetical protein